MSTIGTAHQFTGYAGDIDGIRIKHRIRIANRASAHELEVRQAVIMKEVLLWRYQQHRPATARPASSTETRRAA